MAFTEPDPRDDLSGQDVARKLLILGREIGLRMELDEVKVDSLVPRALRKGRFSEKFFTDLARYDADIDARVAAARRRGSVLRYVGVLENGRAPAPTSRPWESSPISSSCCTICHGDLGW